MKTRIVGLEDDFGTRNLYVAFSSENATEDQELQELIKKYKKR